jgi:hypothetical protein
LTVNATLDGVTMNATADLTVTQDAVPALTQVWINPQSSTLQEGSTQDAVADVLCFPGSCPTSGITYIWSTNNSLISLSTSANFLVYLTAGNRSGSATLTVNATFNGQSVSGSTVITISLQPAKSNSGSSIPWVVIAVMLVALFAAVVSATYLQYSMGSVQRSRATRAQSKVVRPVSGPTPSRPVVSSSIMPPPPPPPPTPPVNAPLQQSTGHTEIPCPECHTLASEGTKVCEVCGCSLEDAWKSVNK